MAGPGALQSEEGRRPCPQHQGWNGPLDKASSRRSLQEERWSVWKGGALSPPRHLWVPPSETSGNHHHHHQPFLQHSLSWGSGTFLALLPSGVGWAGV